MNENLVTTAESLPKKVGVVKPVLLTTVFSLLNYAVVFFTQIIIAKYFGNGSQRDAYLVAYTVPSYLISIFIAALPPVFLPALIELRNSSEEISRKLAGNLLFYCVIGLSLISILCAVFSKNLVELIAPSINPASINLAGSLLIIMAPAIVFNIFSGLLGSLYYANYQFVIPAISLLISSFIALFIAIIFNARFGIYCLAWGFLLGSFLGMIFLLPAIKNVQVRLFPLDKNLLGILKSASPLIFAGVIYQASTIFQQRIASTLPVGSISTFSYSTQIINVLSVLLSGGVAAVIFPLMSDSWSKKDFPKLRDLFENGITIIFLVTVPILGILIEFSLPVISIIFQRGAFSNQDSSEVANVLLVLSGSLVSYSLGNIVAKGFYFSRRTLWSAIQETVILFIYLFLGYKLASIYSLIGLAAASTITSWLSAICSYLFVRYLLKGLDGKKLFISLLKFIVSAAIAGFLSYFIYYKVGLLQNGFLLIGTIILNILAYYLFGLYIMKVKEIILVRTRLFLYIQKILNLRKSEN
jgi:putative peptidoglycan lipid II flippase